MARISIINVVITITQRIKCAINHKTARYSIVILEKTDYKQRIYEESVI